MSARWPRVATYGYFGMGNIGNEGSLEAMLAHLRTRPEGSVSCLAADPVAVERDHGVPAARLMAYRADKGRRGPALVARKLIGRVADVPRTFALTRDVDALVVPGTGVLETQLMAKPWGLPYWLLLAAASCRVRGRPVALVSVGAEPAGHPLTRWCFRSTVRLATYVSFRDAASREVARSWGIADPGPVFPDLAFSLPTPDAEAVVPGHVVIGVMTYEGAPDDPDRGPHRVAEYADHLGEAIRRLVADGGTVTLVVGDVADLPLARDVVRRATASGAVPPGRVTVSDAATLTAIMTEMARAEVVVASRFHNVICALKARRPTVSLGYAGKNERLLTEFGQPGRAQPMESFDVELLLDQVRQARESGPEVEVLAKETLARYDDALALQFSDLSSALLEPARRTPRWRRGRRRRAARPR